MYKFIDIKANSLYVKTPFGNNYYDSGNTERYDYRSIIHNKAEKTQIWED